jgi:DNA-binding transcriptional LysR family regulator
MEVRRTKAIRPDGFPLSVSWMEEPMTFDLNLLLTFEAMDKARSVSGAARLLGLSQPATSAALSRLRKALGDELFAYAGGRMQPTPAARRLAPGLHAALSGLRGTLDAERAFDPARASGTFTVGVTDYASAVIAPALTARLATEAPGMDLELLAYDKAAAGALIDSGACDLVIGAFTDPPDRAVAAPLLQERFVGVARDRHPILPGPPDALAFVAYDHALVTLFTPGRQGRGVVDDALAAAGQARRVRLALPHLMALPPVLRATDLIATVPARAAACFGPGIATFDVGFLGLQPWTLHMLWSPFLRKDRAHAWLRGMVVAACAEL